MKRLLAAVMVAAIGGAFGCKGETKVEKDPQLVADLDACRAAVKDKDELIALLEKENAELKLGSTTDDVVVTLQGDVLDVKAGAGPHQRAGEPKGNAQDAQLYEAFVAEVRESRGAIKKCYQNALKKNTQLQARTVRLNITVNFTAGGTMSSAVFNPRISEQFDQCMEAVGKNWKLPAAPRAVSFQYTMTLTPE